MVHSAPSHSARSQLARLVITSGEGSYSPKFAFWEFSEVRTRLGRVASCLWWKGSSRPRSHVGLRGAHAQGGHVMEARTEADTFTMVALSRHRHRPPHANSPSLSW